MEKRSVWDRLLAIDRRWLYLFLFVNIVFFLLMNVQMPAQITPPAQALYDHIENNLQEGDLVMVSSPWGPSTIAENGPQFQAVIRHLMRKRLRFVIISFEAQARDISLKMAREIADEEGYRYGEDWAHFGFLPGAAIAVRGLSNDIAATVKTDVNGTPVAELPLMQGVRNLNDFKFGLDITASATLKLAWLAFKPQSLTMGYCPTSVMAADAYTYLDSKQIVGMITGAKGAQEYEELMGIEGGLGAKFANAISFSHVLIIIFIIIGNVAMAMARRQAGG